MGASQEEFFPVPPVDGRLALTTKCNTGRRFESLTPSEGICKYKEVFAMSHVWNSRDVAIKTNGILASTETVKKNTQIV